MNQSQMLVDQNNQYIVSHVSTTPGLNNSSSSSSSSASSTPSSSCSSGQNRTSNLISHDFDFLECTNTINLVDRNSLMNLNMVEFHQLNQNGTQSNGGDMVEDYWCANFTNQYMGAQPTANGYSGEAQVVMMPPPPPMPSSSSTPSSSSSSPSPSSSSAPKRGGGARSRKKPDAQVASYHELNAPKPPLTGYQHFFKERQSELRSQDSSLKFADIVKKVGTDWSKNIDKETKNKFIIKGLQDKERYKNELKAYQSNLTSEQTTMASPKMCKKELKSEPDECKLAHLHTPPPSNDSCSPTSLSPNWLNDCCLFTHKDYFNIDAYHSKIIERSLLTLNEIKYLKQKLQQLKLDNKKLNQIYKNSKCDLDKKSGHVTEFSKGNAALKSQLGLFKSLVHACLLNPLVYQQQPPTSTTPNSIQYQMAYSNQAYQQQYTNGNNQSPQQQQQQYYMDSASVYNQQIQLQLQQNQYAGQYYPNNVYMQTQQQQQQQQQQQYLPNGEIYQEGWMPSQGRPAYEDPNQYGQYMQQQQVYQQHQSSQNQNSLQTSSTS